jgi:hypothetical protein
MNPEGAGCAEVHSDFLAYCEQPTTVALVTSLAKLIKRLGELQPIILIRTAFETADIALTICKGGNDHNPVPDTYLEAVRSR